MMAEPVVNDADAGQDKSVLTEQELLQKQPESTADLLKATKTKKKKQKKKKKKEKRKYGWFLSSSSSSASGSASSRSSSTSLIGSSAAASDDATNSWSKAKAVVSSAASSSKTATKQRPMTTGHHRSSVSSSVSSSLTTSSTRRWSTYGRMQLQSVTNDDAAMINSVEARLTAFLKEQRIIDQQQAFPGTSSRTSFSREQRRRRYSNAINDARIKAAASLVVRPFTATEAQRERVTLPETRGFAQLSLRNMRQCWAVEAPSHEDEDAKYMRYYLDEDREGLNIKDVVKDVTHDARQYAHGGSELKADKKNRVEDMKLGKMMLTLDAQKKSTEVLLNKQQQLIKWKRERKMSFTTARDSRKVVEGLRASEARHREFKQRQELFDNAINMLQNGDRTIAQIYRQRLVATRVKQIREGNMKNFKAVVHARRKLAIAEAEAAKRMAAMAEHNRPTSAAEARTNSGNGGKKPSVTSVSSSLPTEDSTSPTSNTDSAATATPPPPRNDNNKKPPEAIRRVKSHDRLLYQQRGISKLERQLQALHLVSSP